MSTMLKIDSISELSEFRVDKPEAFIGLQPFRGTLS